MAIVYPERLPESVLRDEKRSAERKVYEALARLPDEFHIFYSVAWQARSRHSGVSDGEADFVIAHARLGILILEVKGGRIEYDARTYQWTSTDRRGETHLLSKDPVEQARRSNKALLEKLRDTPGWDANRWLTVGHAVVFPDVYAGNAPLKPDLALEILCDAGDMNDLENWVSNTFAYYQAQDGRGGELGNDRLQSVTGLLARSFALKTPLGVELEYEDEHLVELTERQYLVLSILGTRRRAAIRGCAGSGKTMLALEKARRLADEGFEVLLTCYNVALAEDLKGRAPRRVQVRHFHELCTAMVNEAEISLQEKGRSSDDAFYHDILPNALLEATSKLGPRYDAIIVDEGQDFKDTWEAPLSALLRDPDEGIFFIFFDDNQNLYQGQDRLPAMINEEPFVLAENCRNTQKIHRVVSAFYHDTGSLHCPGPVGRQVEAYAYRGDRHQERKMSQLLHQLIVEERVNESDIVILTPRSQDRSVFKSGTRVGRYTLTTSFPPPRESVQVSSVHRFKGLERRVVILAEIDRYASSDLEKVLYVGCSRARTHLLLLVDADAPQFIKDCVRQAIG